MEAINNDGRDAGGRFSAGNKGGPGRPRRSVEADYLREFSDALSLDDWRAVVARAVTDAKTGDSKAREWLSRYALGAQPDSLEQLCVDELSGIGTDDLLVQSAARAIKLARNPALPLYEMGDFSARDEAIGHALRVEQEQAEQVAAELRRQKRAERDARKAGAVT